MTGLIGAFLVALVFYGGGLFSTGQMVVGLGFASVGGVGLGTLFAALQASYKGDRLDTREGLTVSELKMYLIAYSDLIPGDTKVYVGDTGLNLAGSVFNCLLDGGRALVIERKAEPGMIAESADSLF